MEDVMLDLMYDLPSRKNIKRVIITREVVEKQAERLMEYVETKKRA